jgi:hypothetical protein
VLLNPDLASPSIPGLPGKQILSGAPPAPIFSSRLQREFQTRIREGVAKGSGPNFAGHYHVIRWGWGSDCLMMAVVDAESGKVYGPPLSAACGSLEVPMDPLSDREIEFKRDSSLITLSSFGYSARSDSIGSAFAARRAGT